MATDQYITFDGQELVNLSRTAQLAEALGIQTVWTDPEKVEWIEDALAAVNYDDITIAPWYDPGYPASAEFAGLVPLAFSGLDDSSLTSTPVEFTGDGGNAGRSRNATQPLVANMVIVALTDAGAEYGLRWLNRMLRGGKDPRTCMGSDLRYFRNPVEGSELLHRRNVKTTRGSSVTRKVRGSCDVSWFVTFTLTAGDPFEYSDPHAVLADLGGGATGSTSHGTINMVQEACPVYDYSPLQDPAFPSLVAAPTAPDFLPDGWGIEDDMTFTRYWAVVPVPEPSAMNYVPLITLNSTGDARRVRVQIWEHDEDTDNQCTPMFGTVISYLPGGIDFTIDGEQHVSYVWDGFTPFVRRTDALTYSPDGRPVEWAEVADSGGLLVTLDLFTDTGAMEGAGTVRAALSLISKSD